MSVRNYHITICNNIEAPSSYLLALRDRSQISCCISEMNVATVKHVTVLIANLLSTWSRVFPGELTVSQLAKKVPVFYGNARSISTFIKAPPVRILTHINPVCASFYFLRIHFNIILKSTFPPPSGLLSSGLSTKPLYALLLSLIRATCPAHFILREKINRISDESMCHEAPLFVVFSIPPYFVRRKPKYLLLHSFPEHPHPLFLPLYVRPILTLTNNNRNIITKLHL
jgi:hypothetical protein